MRTLLLFLLLWISLSCNAWTSYNTYNWYRVRIDANHNVYAIGNTPFTIYTKPCFYLINKYNLVGTPIYSVASKVSSDCTMGDILPTSTGGLYVSAGYSDPYSSSGKLIEELNATGTKINTYYSNDLWEGWFLFEANGSVYVSGEGNYEQICDRDGNNCHLPLVTKPANCCHDFTMFCTQGGDAFGVSPASTWGDSRDFNNVLSKLSLSTFAVTSSVNTPYSFTEILSNYQAGTAFSGNLMAAATNIFNGIAASCDYVYTTDNALLIKWDKSLRSIKKIRVNNSPDYSYSGMAVDSMDNLYVANGSSIDYYSGFTKVSSKAYPDTVYDIAWRDNGDFAVSGKGFVSYEVKPFQQCSVVLPIDLIKFYASGWMLIWETATETNNRNFTLYYAKVDMDFKPIATIAGAGQSSILKQYSYIITDPGYYAIGQTNYDGREKFYTDRILQINSSGEAVAFSGGLGNNNVIGQRLRLNAWD